MFSRTKKNFLRVIPLYGLGWGRFSRNCGLEDWLWFMLQFGKPRFRLHVISAWNSGDWYCNNFLHEQALISTFLEKSHYQISDGVERCWESKSMRNLHLSYKYSAIMDKYLTYYLQEVPLHKNWRRHWGRILWLNMGGDSQILEQRT